MRRPRAAPLGISIEMILSGEPIDAAEAHHVGLVNRIVELPDPQWSRTDLNGHA